MADTSFLILLFLFGVLLSEYVQLISDRGSFLSSLFDRSRCDSCKKVIPWYALIPFVGRFLVKKQCVHCKAPVPSKYLVFEVLFSSFWGILLYSIFATEPFSYVLYGVALLVMCTTWLLIYEDHKNYSIPVTWLAAWAVSFIAFWYVLGHRELHVYDMLGMLAVLLVSVLTVKVTKRDKDIKLGDLFGAADGIVLALVSLLIGFQGVTGILIASLLTAVIYLFVKKKLKMGESLPLLTMLLPWVLLGVVLLI